MSRRGFTLLETLVALTVTALVLGALGGAVLRTATARTRATAAADRIAAGRTVLLRLTREIEAAVPPPPPGPEIPAERFVVDPPDTPEGSSGLRFAPLSASLAPATSDLRPVAYAFEGGALVRRLGRGEPEELLAGVRRFRVRCSDGSAWHDTWRRGPLPRAVELSLEVDDGSDRSATFGTTVTVAAAGR